MRGSGAWFKLAPGSGIWLNLGRTLAFDHWGQWSPSYTAVRARLRREWLARAAQRRGAAPRINASELRRLPFDGVPVLALGAGYDTLQFHSDGFEPQLLVTAPSSMLKRRCCESCGLLQRAWLCGPREGAGCPRGVELRAGWHDKECACDETRFALNCGESV